MKKLSVSWHTKVYVFSDSVLCFGKMNVNPHSNYAWEDRMTWFKSSSEYRALDTLDGELMEFEWIFPRIHLIAALQKSPRVLVKNECRTRRFHRTDHLHVDVHGPHGVLKKINRNVNQALSSIRFMRKDFHQENGHYSDLDQKRRGILLMKANHKENGTESQNWWW